MPNRSVFSSSRTTGLLLIHPLYRDFKSGDSFLAYLKNNDGANSDHCDSHRREFGSALTPVSYCRV